MTNSDEALGMVGSAMTLMFGVAMIKYAQDSTKDLMKKGRGKYILNSIIKRTSNVFWKLSLILNNIFSYK